MRGLSCDPGTFRSLKWATSVHHGSDQIPERDWREKQKAMDSLMETVELQSNALENLKKAIAEKEKLCSALRVSTSIMSVSIHCRMFVILFWFEFLFPT